MPPRPSATGIARPPAVSQPRRGSPGLRCTEIRLSGLFGIVGCVFRCLRIERFYQ
jgi:hypothetical protein